MKPDPTSTNDKAKEIMGLRNNGKSIGLPYDQPCELGYHCPVCKYELLYDGNFDERLHWSEYEGFLWCEACNKDYPSCLCMPDIDKAINIFLDTVKDARTRERKATTTSKGLE